MIEYYSETDFKITDPEKVTDWIVKVIKGHKKEPGEIGFIFCSDDYLHDLNVRFLGHDTFTDIISFDESLGNEIHGEIYISVDRVKDNSRTYQVSFEEELDRVMIHGILHFCGYKDKTEDEAFSMRTAENAALLLRKSL